jgi:hypothetical protein
MSISDSDSDFLDALQRLAGPSDDHASSAAIEFAQELTAPQAAAAGVRRRLTSAYVLRKRAPSAVSPAPPAVEAAVDCDVLRKRTLSSVSPAPPAVEAAEVASADSDGPRKHHWHKPWTPGGPKYISIYQKGSLDNSWVVQSRIFGHVSFASLHEAESYLEDEIARMGKDIADYVRDGFTPGSVTTAPSKRGAVRGRTERDTVEAEPVAKRVALPLRRQTSPITRAHTRTASSPALELDGGAAPRDAAAAPNASAVLPLITRLFAAAPSASAVLPLIPRRSDAAPIASAVPPLIPRGSDAAPSASAVPPLIPRRSDAATSASAVLPLIPRGSDAAAAEAAGVMDGRRIVLDSLANLLREKVITFEEFLEGTTKLIVT